MNCQRRLSSLLLAAAFALGVLAAQVHAATTFLPLVASATTGHDTPTPPPPATVMVQNLTYHPSAQRFYGELVNYTPCTVNATGVTMYFLDAAGLPVANTTGSSLAPLLAPGQRTPFCVHWYDPLPPWASYVIYPQWDPVDRLTIDSATLSHIHSGLWTMTVTLHNQLPVRVQALRVAVVGYDLAGGVIAYDEGWELHGPLDPGDTLTVHHNFYSPNSETKHDPVTCAAFAVPHTHSPYLLTDEEP